MKRPLLQFGDFELDPNRYELRQAGRAVKLERMPLELLILLAERQGVVVTRQEIVEKLWSRDAFVDSERSINTAINKIRRALHDDAGKPQFVQTVVGKGYRFLLEDNPQTIENVGPLLSAPTPSLAVAIRPVIIRSPGTPSHLLPNSGKVSRAHTGNHRTRFYRGAIAIGITVALLAITAFLIGRNGYLRLVPGPPPKVRSIAVLPMVNFTQDPNQEFFVDGMTDQLITNLAQRNTVRVISRSSVMQYKGVQRPLREIAKALDVDAVVEGSVIRSDDRVRIIAQLVDARTDRHLWARTYDRKLSDTFALQDDVARDIAEEISVTLAPEESTAQLKPANFAAYENYLRGRYYWAKRTPESLSKALEYFEMAIDADPGYAMAYVGLADTYSVISFYGGPPPAESFRKAEIAVKKALAINSNLGETHTTLGNILFSYNWDWPAAEREFRRGIEINPGYATAHHWYSHLLSAFGRHDEALLEIRRAEQLDPLSFILRTTEVSTLYYARRYDEAIAKAKEILELDSSLAIAHATLGWVYLYKGPGKEALASFQRAIDLSDNSPTTLAGLACAYAVIGQRSESRAILSKLESISRMRFVSPITFARLYLANGDENAAMGRLEEAYRLRVDTLNHLNIEPAFDRLRSDPRFQSLLRRMGFIR